MKQCLTTFFTIAMYFKGKYCLRGKLVLKTSISKRNTKLIIYILELMQDVKLIIYILELMQVVKLIIYILELMQDVKLIIFI